MAALRELGPFELLGQLGAGGMGEVYLARDRRLNRQVAIKLLPEGAGATARDRFQREALAIAALNHPHICILHESGVHEGQPFLVMELLEGETLHARLARGPIAPAQVLQWGAEIADALQAAHAKGILHRDLKPGNIFITQRGTVKVLDFGLAQFAAAAAAEVAADAPTISAASPVAVGPLTSPGSTLGTYAYMSPEQARGEPTDARSDLFSLGVVLYEMATGQLPFQGRTAADLSAAILLQTPPPPSSIRTEIPARLDDIIAQCLEKDPDQRFQSAADLRIALRRVAGASSAPPSSAPASSAAGAAPISVAPAGSAPPSSATGPPAARRSWLLPAIITAIVVIVVAGFGWRYWNGRPAPPPRLAFRQLTFNGNVVDAVISPDGKFLAHVDNSSQGISLHLLSISSGSDVEIMPPAPGCCQSPSFSPDGGQVYFLDGRALDAVAVLGGAVRTIAKPACSGAGFSPDGSRIAYVTSTAPAIGLVIASADGSQARLLNHAPTGAGYMSQCWINSQGQPSHSPAWSPDGRLIAVAEAPVSGDSRIDLVNAATGEGRFLGPGIDNFSAADPSWLPDGSGLVFTGELTPASSTSQVLEVSYPGGRATQITNDLQGYIAISLAANGQLAVVHRAPQSSLWVQTRPGGEFRQLPGNGVRATTWTPQGDIVSIRRQAAQNQLWIEHPDGSDARMLSGALPALSYDPQVAPDGEIVFGDGNTGAIWRIGADGSGLARLAAPAAGENLVTPSLIGGGGAVSYLKIAANAFQSMWAVPLAGGAPRQLWSGFAYAGSGSASRDGSRMLVFARGPHGEHQTVILRVDGAQPQVTPVVGWNRTTMEGRWGWTTDGKALTYISGQGSVDNVWAFPLGGAGQPAGKPYPLTHFTDLNAHAYAFAADGRLAVVRVAPNADAVLATGLGH